MKTRSWIGRLRRRSERKGGTFPAATIAFYGPDNRHASKVAVGIVASEDARVEPLERWYEKNLDVRVDPRIGEEVTGFLKSHGVRSVVVGEGIIGCPHEEGKDYPDGEECPECPFWKGKDRFEHAIPD